MPRTFETLKDGVLLCWSNGKTNQDLWMNAGGVSFLIHFALGNNYKPQGEDESNLEIKEEQGIWLWNSVCLYGRHYYRSPISGSCLRWSARENRTSLPLWWWVSAIGHVLANEIWAEELGGTFNYLNSLLSLPLQRWSQKYVYYRIRACRKAK